MKSNTPSPYRAVVDHMDAIVRPFGLRIVVRKGRPQRFQRDPQGADVEGAWDMLRAYARQLRTSDDLRCYSDTVEIAARMLAGPHTYPHVTHVNG